ncbi:F-box protein [Hordeum vulgare]|nr:F-box protein [Hordeum vulgare]
MAEDAAAGARRWRGEEGQQPHRLAAAAGAPEDRFDGLPDPLLLLIFNRIGDVKALGRCALVSRRFHALVPLVDSVLVRVDCVIPDDPASSSPSSPTASASARARGVFSQIARMVIGGIVKPIQALGQILSHANSAADFPASAASLSSFRRSSSLSSSSAPHADVSHHSPSEVLRSFKELRSLRIELPAGELGMDDGVLLKWKADFGSTLGSCVILGAASASASPSSAAKDGCSTATPPPAAAADCGESDDSGSIPESFYTNGGLKLRVLWTISSLIAASARHYLLQPIISDHALLESLDLTDADGQGVLTMDKWQLQELRVRPVSASGDSHRTLMPALSMRLWYAPQIELPGGTVLNGATLVAIKPSEEAMRDAVGNGTAGSAGGSWVSDAFEEPYRTAVGVLLKRRMYSLEMNSF